LSTVRQSLTARALAIIGTFAIVLVSAVLLLVVAIENLRDAGRAAVLAQQAVTAGTELERSVVSLDNGLKGYVATGKRSQLAPFDIARRQYPRQVARLQRLAAGDIQLRREAQRISGEITDYVQLWAVPLLGVARDDLEVARSVIVNSTGRVRVDRIRSAFDAMFGRARREAAAREHRADQRSRLAIGMGIAGIALVLVLTGLLAALLRRGVLRPIGRVARATETVAAGDLTARVPEDRSDELGDLARAFNAMAESLERSREELAERAQDLERSNRELEDYASVTSHDLQGPLVTIGMYAELLAGRVHDDEARDLATHIRDGAAAMRRLVRELLAYARLERSPGRREPVELAQVVQEALENLAGPVAAASAEVSVGDFPVVMGDANRLVQVVQNLLTNALKFSEGPPRVDVWAEPAGDGETRVSVRDHGIGFEPGKSDLIFRPFHRLHGADRFEGTGIGLAVCQKIVDQHGGRIWAESAPGEGATFSFTLALAAPEPAPAPVPEELGSGASAV
jgi:signal transduction histidine kinase